MGAKKQQLIHGLPPAHWEIARLVRDGLRNQDVADIVGKTEYAIKCILQDIFDATGMNSRLELAMWVNGRDPW